MDFKNLQRFAPGAFVNRQPQKRNHVAVLRMFGLCEIIGSIE